MLTNEQLKELLGRYRLGLCDNDEIQRIELWYQQELDRTDWDFQPGEEARVGAMLMDRLERRLGLQQVQEGEAARDQEAEYILPGKHRVFFLRRWAAVAAVIILLAGVGGYFWWARNAPKGQGAATGPSIAANDVLPGGNKAVLTLGDGKQIILDSARQGKLGIQGNSSISKTDSGKLVYQPMRGAATAELIYNTLATPRGGQYQLTLPDGTRVWLNAASSIRYPAAFTKETREVFITGEAYFEIAANARKPFIVTMGQGGRVEVLGTHFNVFAYEDEDAVRTTLLEGKVRVLSTSYGDKQEAVMLSPGEQGVLDPSGKLVVKKDVNLESVMAWKNGEIVLNEEGVEMIMRQISRWYDVDVHYNGVIPVRRFNGMIDRKAPLSGVLSVLRANGVHVSLEGKIITVSP